MNASAQELPLDTPRMVLEPLLPDHASLIYDDLLNPKLYQFIPQEPPGSVNELEERYRFLSARKSPDGQETWLNWAARVREGGDYIGTFQATIHPDKRAEIAYMVFVQFWRQGYGEEGARRLLGHLFTDYEVEAIAAEIDTRNVASIRLAEAIGFRRVSTSRNADFFKGAASDEYRYEMTRSQFDSSTSKRPSQT